MVSPVIQNLVNRLRRLPGIGTRSAERIVFHLMAAQGGEIAALADSLTELGERICTCGICGNLSDSDPCPVCGNPEREREIICVVEQVEDLYAIERSSQYRGLYHVLGGVLSPIAGIGPNELSIGKLVERVRHKGVRELIVATNTSTEGEATALYLVHVFKEDRVRLTRIAHGIPVGGHLSYVDSGTMAKALEGRRPLS